MVLSASARFLGGSRVGVRRGPMLDPAQAQDFDRGALNRRRTVYTAAHAAVAASVDRRHLGTVSVPLRRFDFERFRARVVAHSSRRITIGLD
jgi:hypothetical protein